MHILIYVYIFAEKLFVSSIQNAVKTTTQKKNLPCFHKEELERMAYILKAIAHPNRLTILALLNQYKELNVSALCDKMECAQALVSHHLTDMQSKGILHLRKEGRHAFYSLVDDHLTQAMKCILRCQQFQNT